MKKPEGINTKTIPTWCPGCPNYMILAGFKKYLNSELEKGKNKDDFALVTGIGCHAKLFDYVNLNGINTLHGRVPPTCLGIKIGNPNLKVFGFSGDGDAYAEGMAHTINAARYNAEFTYTVHNNQVFALTVGQPTPVSELGFTDKTTPLGVKVFPINPLRIMLAAGATFVARVFADIAQVEWAFKEAAKHKGFAFIEILQPCLIFHPQGMKYKDQTYFLEKEKHDKTDFDSAWKKAGEFNYNTIDKKIPLGVFYQVKKPVFEDQLPQIAKLKKEKKSWRDIKR